jgi:hypothetical protein
LTLAILAWTCGSQKETHQAANVLVGTVYVIGNEPFTRLSIQTADHRTRIIQEDTTKLFRNVRSMQGQKVRMWFHPVNEMSDSTHIVIERFERVKD